MRWLCVLVLVGCGPAFKEGPYDVTAHLEDDGCGGLPDTAHLEWELEETDTGWEIENESGGTIGECDEEDDSSLICGGNTTSNINGCLVNESDGISISATTEGFEGFWTGILTACDGSSCQADWSIEAELDD
jgi:hypothetical protein